MLEHFFIDDRAEALQRLTEDALAAGRHGDLPKWQAALDALPTVDNGWAIDEGVLVAGAPVADREALTATLQALIPWRKGPLRLGGVSIDTEWRSDWKWSRVAPHLELSGARVLDIGAGNGYFGWRMLEAGAARVIGCDPTLLFWHQFKAIEHFAGPTEHLLLPLKFEQIPPRADFDVVFSMGVLYHRRDPIEHLQRIFDHLAPGGLAVIETLIIPGDSDDQLDPPDRYANMRNVHALPTARRLQRWLEQTGFSNPRIVDVTPTTTLEQRSTDWMPFHSLAEALTADRGLTVEGHPSPLRTAVLARRV
jgi:tRNA (mo5U34)-methyltransferase